MSGVARWSERCPACGYEPRTVSPTDAAVAARSYPRRWRGLLVRPDEEDPEIVHRRPGPGEPSALEHAGWAAAGMRAAAEALRLVRVHDRPEVVPDGPAAGGGPPPGGPLELGPALAGREAAAAALADAVDPVRGEEWRRPARDAVSGADLAALDIARLGVHAGIHHLRAAEAVLRRVRGRP